MSQQFKKPAALMFQGTGSDVGKSLLVAGLCRAFKKRGLKVAPFKPQNMSNNAAVTEDGGEIGRAQALQARACGLPLSVHMNPVLLKPQTDVGAQVIVQGHVLGNKSAKDYSLFKKSLMAKVLESFEIVSEGCDLVLVEGAGSAAEVNLRANDIANMGFAEAASIPVVIIGDIDRGGVIASLVGTHELLPQHERERLAGYLINKFRGDASLFDDGLKLITEKTGMASFGVVPWFGEASRLPAEDAAGLLGTSQAIGEPDPEGDGRIVVAVPRLSRIANFDDLDPLIAEPDVDVRFISAGSAIPGNADVIILPGSKATLAELRYIRKQGWDIDITAHFRRGGMIVGICGGYQMLGNVVRDPQGIEGPAGEEPGLGLLNVDTTMEVQKVLWETEGTEIDSHAAVKGYHMHMGDTEGPDRERPWLALKGCVEGAVSRNGRVMGSYLHGLFNKDEFRHAFLDRLREGRGQGVSFEAQVEETLDALADHLEKHADLDGLLKVAQRA